MDLPEPVAHAVAPLLQSLPLDRAMPELVVVETPGNDMAGMVETMLRDATLRDRPELKAGLWLYVDQLDRSHTESQGLDDATGAFWHGIMHRREGDFSNSHYWFNRVGRHPVMDQIDDYDGHAFIDEVEAVIRKGRADEALVERQRREWVALFEWCARNG